MKDLTKPFYGKNVFLGSQFQAAVSHGDNMATGAWAPDSIASAARKPRTAAHNMVPPYLE